MRFKDFIKGDTTLELHKDLNPKLWRCTPLSKDICPPGKLDQEIKRQEKPEKENHLEGGLPCLFLI